MWHLFAFLVSVFMQVEKRGLFCNQFLLDFYLTYNSGNILPNGMGQRVLPCRRQISGIRKILATTDFELLQMQDLLVERVRQSCAAEKEQERKAMHEKFYELGQVVVQRCGSVFCAYC